VTRDDDRKLASAHACPECGSKRTKPWGKGWLAGSRRQACTEAACGTVFLVKKDAAP